LAPPSSSFELGRQLTTKLGGASLRYETHIDRKHVFNVNLNSNKVTISLYGALLQRRGNSKKERISEYHV